MLTAAISTYGAQGTCWDLPGVTHEDCGTECRANMQLLEQALPEVEACWACRDFQDCTSEAPFCVHTCTEGEWLPNPNDPALDQWTCHQPAHLCAVDPSVHCDTRETNGKCTQAAFPGTPISCQSLMTGRCASDGVVGRCSWAGVYSVTYYADGGIPWDAGAAEQQCTSLGGAWRTD